MNQFVYIHALSSTKKANKALENEALDVGLLPMGSYYHYGLIEINSWRRSMEVTIFHRDEKKLIKHLKASKSSDIILFRYNPYPPERFEGIDLDKEPLPILNEMMWVNDQYFILGDILTPNNDEYTKFFKALGLTLPRNKTPDADKEMFMAQFAFMNQGTMANQIIAAESCSFIIAQYDLSQPSLTGNSVSAKVEKLWFGCNNDKMRVWRNDKFLALSSRYSTEKGRIERKGKIMGGNTIEIDFMQGLNGTIKPKDYFIKPYNESHKRSNLTPYDVGLSKASSLKGFYKYDEKNLTFIHYDSEPSKVTREEINELLENAAPKNRTIPKPDYKRILVKAEDALTAKVVIFR